MVPNYKDMMFLILKFIYKNTRVTLREVYGEAYGFLIKDFCCKPDELKRVVTNGKFVYEDRASWALTYLIIPETFRENNQDKSLIKRVERGVYEITEYGKKLFLSNNVHQEFEKWKHEIFNNKSIRNVSQKDQLDILNNKEELNYTPIEVIERAANELNEYLKSKILDEISQKDPSFLSIWWRAYSKKWATE